MDRFLELFEPLIEEAGEAYCAANGKDADTLTDEDALRIVGRVAQVADEELAGAIMQGQQVPELFDIAKELPAQEDFRGSANYDSINFRRKWTHSETKVGAGVSLEELGEGVAERSDAEAEQEYRLLRDKFLEKLGDTDRRIVELREQGLTQSQIADALGYKTQAAVSKRLQSIRQALNQFLEDTK